MLVAAQWFGQLHRVLHAGHGAEVTQELWLTVANGGEVSAAAWTRGALLAANAAGVADPWHSHDTESDCALYDALCFGDSSTVTVTPHATAHTPPARFTRRYVAHFATSATHTHARAPPLA